MAIERVSGLTENDHGLDEIVASAVWVHLERMNNNHIWMVVTDQNGETVTVNLHAKGTIKAQVEKEQYRAAVGKDGGR